MTSVTRVYNRAFNGEFGDNPSVFDPINEACLEKIETKLDWEKFESDLLKACNDPLKRVKAIRSFYKWEPFSPQVLSETYKNANTSKALRDLANDFYKNKQWDRALRGYNLAVVFAPPKSEELGLAYANRSAVLFVLGLMEDCCRDIKLAFSNGYPATMAEKLDSRRSKAEARSAAASHSENVVKERERRRKFAGDFLFRLKKPSSELEAAEEFVKVESEEGRGRKLVVTRDIPAGTVLLVESPFVSILSNELKWDMNHCHYCLKKISSGIPCSSCTFAMYCDDSCLKKSSEEIHGIECGVLSHLHCSSAPRYMILAFRTVVKLGAKQLNQIWGSEKPEKANVFQDYSRIQSLISHADKLSPMELYSNTLCALILVSALDEYSDFFKDIPDKAQKDQVMAYTAATMLSHLENIPCNSISLDQVEGLEGLPLEASMNRLDPEQVKHIVRGMNYQQYAAAIYGVCSLINHSCDPNVTRINGPQDGTLAVVATRGLVQGEEICTCYSKYFVNEALPERRAYLESNYFFTCTCIACRFDWPQLGDPRLQTLNYTCSQCCKTFKREDKFGDGIKLCLLKGKSNLKCGRCDSVYLRKDLEQEFDKCMQGFVEACHLVTSNYPVEGIRLLFSISKYFDNCICPPYSKSSMIQDVLKHALELIVHYAYPDSPNTGFAKTKVSASRP